jgi:hypothetical protein
MAKRKVTSKQLNIRMPDDLHKRVTSAAKKNGCPVNRELVRRLEASFAEHSIAKLIRETAMAVVEEVSSAHLSVVISEFNRVYQLLGRPDLVVKVQKGEQDNG